MTMRPRLRSLVTEQLLAVEHRIAELRLLEGQLEDVLRRLERAAGRPDEGSQHHVKARECAPLRARYDPVGDGPPGSASDRAVAVMMTRAGSPVNLP